MIQLLLLKGAPSTEHDISLISAKYLRSQLDQIKDVCVHEVLIDKKDIWRWTLEEDGRPAHLTHQKELVIEDEGLEPRNHRKIKIDIVYPMIHGYPGESGHLQAWFELLKLPCLGPDFVSSSLCLLKDLTKTIAKHHQVKTAKWLLLRRDDSSSNTQKLKSFFESCAHGVVIKAEDQGSSHGVYMTGDFSKLHSFIQQAFQLSEHVLIEERLKNIREIEVAVVEYEGKILASHPGEILNAEDDFYSYENKYQNNSSSHVLAKATLNDTLLQDIKNKAIECFSAMRLKHFARIDLFLDHNNQIYLNEINTCPGMTEISLFPKMLEDLGLSIKDLMDYHIHQLL